MAGFCDLGNIGHVPLIGRGSDPDRIHDRKHPERSSDLSRSRREGGLERLVIADL
jgi:hypothetical protein